jgi:hypothetical protein
MQDVLENYAIRDRRVSATIKGKNYSFSIGTYRAFTGPKKPQRRNSTKSNRRLLKNNRADIEHTNDPDNENEQRLGVPERSVAPLGHDPFSQSHPHPEVNFIMREPFWIFPSENTATSRSALSFCE